VRAACRFSDSRGLDGDVEFPIGGDIHRDTAGVVLDGEVVDGPVGVDGVPDGALAGLVARRVTNVTPLDVGRHGDALRIEHRGRRALGVGPGTTLEFDEAIVSASFRLV
jgi:hypothetical protein